MRILRSSLQLNPNGSGGGSGHQSYMNGHSKGDLSRLRGDVFNTLSEQYLSSKDMARLSCVSKETRIVLNQFAQRVSEYLRKELNKKITQTEIDGIQISPGPFRKGIQEMSVLEMQNNNLGTAINVLEAKNIKNINQKNIRGMPPLHYAVYCGCTTLVDALITAGANVNMEDDRGNTPLHMAVYTGYAPVVVALIAGGANVNMEDYKGDTPLHMARFTHNATVIDALIAAGANDNFKLLPEFFLKLMLLYLLYLLNDQVRNK